MKHSFKGLTSKEVDELRQLHGSNELSQQETEGFFSKLKNNFKDPIIIILCVALVFIFILSIFHLAEWYEAVAIAFAVLLATFVSTYSEYKNENSFQKLQEEASQIKNKVFRNGAIIEVPINDIVVSDYVLLQSGDKIPADGKIIEGEVHIDQASLTGESESVLKTKAQKGYITKNRSFSDPHLVFRGSVVDEGDAVMIVETTGKMTFFGQLAKELSIKNDRLSPLQTKLKGLAHLISRFGYFGATLIAISYLFKSVVIANNFNQALIIEHISNWQIILPEILNATVLAIIIIVAAIPEGLPMMIAIVLSMNMRKMLNAKVLVRKLLGIETAGSIDILFSDKTGTITKGQLEPIFFITGEKTKLNWYNNIPDKLREITKTAISENSFCVLSPDGLPIGGNMSERALVSFIEKNERIQSFKSETEIVNKILFDSSRKFSASQVILKNNHNLPFNKHSVTFVKGAVEIILQNCQSFYNNDGHQVPFEEKTSLLEIVDELANTGIRLIALAASNEPITTNKLLPEELIFIGVIGIRDEIRKESKQSIKAAQKAGIQVVMITGDRKGTAMAIASEVGLIEDDSDLALTSTELNQYTDEELKKILPKIRVIARALPTDKSRLVKISQSIGRVVGMTGDGVNDSAALKLSDVGFAMGSGSEVAKEAGDIIIMDDNFSSITNAVLYGRTIFKSIRKFIIFQLTVNVAAVLTVFLCPFFGINFPLTIIQILWINIIMDTLAAIAFGGEPALNSFMKEKPIKRDANILTRYMKSEILTGGLYITAFSIFFLTYEPFQNLFVRNGTPDNATFMTAFFNLFIFMIIFNSFNARTEKMNLFHHITENKKFIVILLLLVIMQVVFTYIGGEVLRTVSLNSHEWLIVLILAIIIIPVDLGRKLFIKLGK